MAKFHGMIGYMQSVETAPGVYRDEITERPCNGDLLRNSQSAEAGENLNDNINISNRFSVIADAFAYANIVNIRYIKWQETKWKVNNIDIQRPRIILSVRGVYNG